MSLSAIRTKIKDALDTIGGIEVYDTVPSVVNPPCAFPVLRPVNPVEYDFTARNASLVYHFYIDCLVLKGSTVEQAIDELDTYCLPAGTTSIKAAIEDISWGTTADCCRVSGVSQVGPAIYGGVEYYGARFDLDVWRSS